ncbi:hypothetical protein [Flavobacterium sp.]|uniref:hypothetical protein n=1 Tax=Flavobacterium sp. TaxID=239 RepID=UPI0039E632F7
MKKILPLFSYLFHPIFMPLLAVSFYLFAIDNYFVLEQKLLVLVQVSIIMVFIPLCFFFLLKTLGKVNSIMLSDASQRRIPLFIQALLIITLITKSLTQEVVPELFYFFLGALASTVAAFALLFAGIKASLHMVGISALTVFVIGLNMHYQYNAIGPIAFLILMNGTVAASRLEMQAHTTKELLIGFLAGVLPQLGCLYFWL